MARRLISKYLLAALGIGSALTLLIAALLYYDYRVKSSDTVGLTFAAVQRQLEADLASHAQGFADAAALRVAAPLAAHDKPALRGLAEALLAEHDVTRIEIADGSGTIVFSENIGADPGDAGPLHVTAPVIALVGGNAAQRIGTVQAWLSRASVDATLDTLQAGLANAHRNQFRHVLTLIAGIGLPLLTLGLATAWLIGRRLVNPISALVKSADRMREGDYSRPLSVMRHDELGDLQQALELMRQNLRDTTITKNYLDTVLNSLGDAVLVTSPEGVIKSCNEAAQRLIGCSGEELIGRQLISLIDEPHRAAFDPAQAAQETRETVVRTHSGQTIPVSMSGSQIASHDPQFQGNIYVARDITDRKRAERRIRYLARYDTLTKMPNRMQFQHLLQQAIARARKNNKAVALLYLDMDRFKEVNDTFGHAAGDRTLEVLSERLTRILTKESVIGRLAGDEFALFIDGLPMDVDNRAALGTMARTLLDEIARAFYVSEEEVFMSASVGIAICPFDAENVIDLIRNADAAMYHSKQNGGNSYAFYVPDMNAAAVERLMLKSKLRRAVERDELVILYEPKVDLRDGKVVGAEALLRWRLAGHGDIPPSQFIPLAEETTLILEVGEWVMNRVCSDYTNWQRDIARPGRISINLSLRQLKQASFISRCRAVFQRHKVSPTSFELEVTETTLMTDAKRTVRLLDELFAMGLNLAIDDFGTGYSSLSALQQFPIGTLKIDKSFVRNVVDNPNDATIVRTIIDMGKSLEMEVVAEGVETQEQLEFLRRHGCHFAQGRLFGEAWNAGHFLDVLRSQREGQPYFAAACDTPVLARLQG